MARSWTFSVPRAIALAGAVAGGAAVALGAGQAPAPAPTSQLPLAPQIFQSGVSIITTDVTVLDSRTRRPVHGLTAADFTITENGTPQAIKAFTEIVVPPPATDGAPWTREVVEDVTTNSLESRRLVVILMGDETTGVDRGESKSSVEIANAVIDQLGPSDLAAVVHAFTGRMENFTTDRTKLRAAVKSFRPQYFPGTPGARVAGPGPPAACGFKASRSCFTDALIRIGDILKTAPPSRKIVVFTSPPVTAANIDPNTVSALSTLGQTLASLQAANITLYQFDPRGLVVGGFRQANEIGLAESTGGRFIEQTNAPELLVPDVFQESSNYYLLAYESTNTRTDGRYRNVRIRVNRPDVEVIARNGYFAPRGSPKPAKTSPLRPEEQALVRGLPSGDLPLSVTAAAFAGSGGKAAEIVAVLGLREPPPEPGTDAASRRVNLLTAAFDPSWRQRGGQRQSVDLSLAPNAERASEYEVRTRLTVPPGRYELRIAAERLGRAGSLFLSLDVPDFAKEPLSVSGLLVERVPPRRFSAGASLEGLVPVIPTTIRTFTPADRASTFLRVYQGGSRALQAVNVTTVLKDERDVEAHRTTTALAPAAFSSSRAADYRFALPTGDLAPGAYLLRLGATMGDRHVERMLRFSIAP